MDVNTTLSETDKQTLEQSAVFKGLPAKEMSPILAAAEIKVYQPEQTIMSTGDVGDGIYVILEGQVTVYLPQMIANGDDTSEHERKIHLATLTQGDCLGEYSLVDQKEISANVQAITLVRLGYLSTSDFYRIARTHLLVESIIYKNLLQVLVARCRKANRDLDPDHLIY